MSKCVRVVRVTMFRFSISMTRSRGSRAKRSPSPNPALLISPSMGNVAQCAATSAADGASCGAQMANDASINLVLTGTLLNGNTELYNALNGNPVLTYNNTFVPGGTWLQPRSILTPRLFRITAEFTF